MLHSAAPDCSIVDSLLRQFALLVGMFDLAHLGHEIGSIQHLLGSATASEDEVHIRRLLRDHCK